MIASPDDSRLADDAGSWRSAYVHVPFCARLCPYCDFAVVVGRDDSQDRYLAALLAEIAMEPEWSPLDAVFFGGGTPSRFDAERLGAVLALLRDRFGLADDVEVSLEANPEDWSVALAKGLARQGFNRVSFGAQSFDPAVLSALGRRHRAAQIGEAVRIARANGFRSLSLDLIFGAEGESIDSWETTLDDAIDLQPDHVSTYALTVERGTELSRRVAAGAPPPDPDDQADKWEKACSALAGAGLIRYEVSNHARPGHPCRYNLSVWDQGEYLGVGLGAHGHRDGIRRRNYRRLDAYLQAVETGRHPGQAHERVDGWGREQERLLLGLRRAAGVTAGPGGRLLWASWTGRRLAEAGVLTLTDDRLVVTRPLLTDEVSRAVAALPPG